MNFQCYNIFPGPHGLINSLIQQIHVEYLSIHLYTKYQLMLHEKDKESHFLMFFIYPNYDNLEKRWIRKDSAIHEKIKPKSQGVMLLAEE